MKRSIVFLAFACAMAAQVRLPQYTRETVANGTTVYIMRRPGAPLVNFRVLVKGGHESEPGELAGVASVTAELLRRGTERRTASQFAEELDGLGGTLGSGVDGQSTVLAAEFLKKDFEHGLDLVSDAVLHAAFPEDEVRKELARRSDALVAMKDNPGAAIAQYWPTFFFGPAHPYARIPDENSLGRIKRDDIVAYHQKIYVGRNLIVIVVGDIDPADAKARIVSTFGAAPAGTAYAWAEDRPPKADRPRVLLVDKPDATQTYFVIAQPGIRRNSPDRVPLELVNLLFGGRFTSMLNEELRINSGLTYGASCRVQMERLTGAIAINTYTKTDTTGKAIDLALDVLKRIGTRGITAEQLASAKAYLKGTYPPQHLQTSDQLAAILGDLEIFGLGRDEVDDFFSRIDAVTLEQANDVARRHYRAEDLTFVLVGSAAKVKDIAAKYGPDVTQRSIRDRGWAGL